MSWIWWSLVLQPLFCRGRLRRLQSYWWDSFLGIYPQTVGLALRLSCWRYTHVQAIHRSKCSVLGPTKSLGPILYLCQRMLSQSILVVVIVISFIPVSLIKSIQSLWKSQVDQDPRPGDVHAVHHQREELERLRLPGRRSLGHRHLGAATNDHLQKWMEYV